MINPDCPECRGTGKYVGLNKIEPCSICSVDNLYIFELPLELCDKPQDNFKFLTSCIKDAAKHFGEYNDRVQDEWMRFIADTLNANHVVTFTPFISFLMCCKKPGNYPSDAIAIKFATKVEIQEDKTVNVFIRYRYIY